MILLLLAACGGQTDRIETLDALASWAQAQYDHFAQEATAFADGIDCADPQASQDAWMSLRGVFKRTELIQFGPIVEPPRLGPPLDTWPARPSAIEELIASDDPLDAPSFQNKGSVVRGMPPTEWSLWADPALTDPRNCEYLADAAGDLAHNANLLATEWRENWAPRLSAPTTDDPMYPGTQFVLDEWVNRTVFTIENIRKDKLGKPLGDAAGGEPQPDTIESPYSERSLADAIDALDGVADVLTVPSGLLDLTKKDDLGENIRGLLDDARAALNAVPEPLSLAIVDHRDRVVAAQDALLALQVGLQVDLAQALNVTIAFNDNDGD